MVRAYMYGEIAEDRVGLSAVLGLLAGITVGTLLATWTQSQGPFAPVPPAVSLSLLGQGLGR